MLNNKKVQRALGSSEPPVFDGYEIVRRLGLGAASIIFAVKNKETEELRALKHVIRQEGEDGRMIEQVETEFRIGSRIDHPYIRKVFEIQRRKRRFQTREVLLLMEYCSGISLEQSPSRSLLDLLLIFRMVADGLGGMHSHGILHCDIKPNNIIIADNGAIRIIDLGQSCNIGTVKPRIQGTPDYIAPEQVKRKPLTQQTDVFNLGATMYWALTGKHVPTLIPKNTDRVDLISEAGPPQSPNQLKPQIPIGVSNLIMDCIKNSPRDRPGDMPTVVSRLDLLIHMIAGGRPVANGNK
jgi:eukaryotic-like serine/threonine-protein kinase